jgi:hypothetical protein
LHVAILADPQQSRITVFSHDQKFSLGHGVSLSTRRSCWNPRGAQTLRSHGHRRLIVRSAQAFALHRMRPKLSSDSAHRYRRRSLCLASA